MTEAQIEKLKKAAYLTRAVAENLKKSPLAQNALDDAEVLILEVLEEVIRATHNNAV